MQIEEYPTQHPEFNYASFYKGDGTLTTLNRFTAIAAASLYTCSADLSKFMLAHVSDNDVLSRASIEELIKPQTYINDIPVYASGPHLYSQDDADSYVVGHDVSDGAVINTAARIDLKPKSGFIILESGHYDIASGLADAWLFYKFGIEDFCSDATEHSIPAYDTTQRICGRDSVVYFLLETNGNINKVAKSKR